MNRKREAGHVTEGRSDAGDKHVTYVTVDGSKIWLTTKDV